MTREEALEIMEARKYICGGCERDCSCKECCTAYDMAIEALEERKTGKWVRYNGKFYYDWICSECDSCSHERTDYCPMCGAKMEDEE